MGASGALGVLGPSGLQDFLQVHLVGLDLAGFRHHSIFHCLVDDLDLVGHVHGSGAQYQVGLLVDVVGHEFLLL